MKRVTAALALASAALAAGCTQGDGPSLAELDRRISRFQSAVEKGDAAAVERMLAEDPGLGRMVGGTGGSPVRAAVAGKHLAVLEKLLVSAPDLMERNEAGQTLLHDAASIDASDVAAFLIAQRVPVDAVDHQGATPLAFAASATARATMLVLLEKGARLDRRDKEGRTPLHRVHPTSVEGTALLCASGADASLRDGKGFRPRDAVSVRLSEYSVSDVARFSANANLALLEPAACAALAARKLPRAQLLAASDVLASEAQCGAGHALSCRNSGVSYEHGTKLPQDLPRAQSLYQRACDLEDVTGCGYLGSAFEKAFAGRKDLGRARALYAQACDAGDAWSCGSLGDLYYDGRGVAEDDQKAAALFRKACDGGSTWSCGQLGHATERGNGVPRDAAAAARIYEDACGKDHAYACWRLSELLREGTGVARDTARAATLAGKACAGGEERACAPAAKRS